ncbi:deformed epidermal autoregulatory factor 1 [Cimex lectularius]|uniref:Deformed epidermal autoregulatory factor 1 n=1 Tax=Cimex lectularius TaxID=79782 RepID=A0A8I6SQ19_CIMLE|nr:deformed epidermal autoregulatory factor 1 [Cimex lectularius]
MPDMADPLADKSEGAEEQSSPRTTTVSVSTVDGLPVTVSAPVSVPVASLINVAGGTTAFNVITPEQLQLASTSSLRPILCVDNSCICDSSHHEKECNEPSHRTQWFTRSENGHLKATTHIVIENNTEEGTVPNNASWLASAAQPVIPIRCKSTSAELHKSRFGSGGRGRCIFYGNQWYTPSEFEILCGRGSSKDWKRSIRFGGRSLNSLIEGGFLTPHATSCTCSACCDDDRAVGPVRLFSPYRRKRKREQNDDDSRKTKIELSNNGNSTNGEESYDSDIEQPTKSANNSNSAGNVVSKTELDDSTNGSSNITETLNRLDKMTSKLMKLVFSLRKEVDDVKSQWKAEKEQMLSDHKREKEQAVLTARVEAQVACSRVFDSTVHVVDPSITTVGLQPTDDSSDNKKCANCNRDAFAECSLCRRTPYCSAFCQRKDWGSHQVECVRSATNDQSSSIMLIVESSDQVLGVQE